VQILNSVVRHFQFGISYSSSTNAANLLIEDTTASDNLTTGIIVGPPAGNTKATLNRITANNNSYGVSTASGIRTTIANSVISNNSVNGLETDVFSLTYLAKTVISGNATGVSIAAAGQAFSYGDNYIANNTTPVGGGSLTLVSMQ
jgi:hypothetical protein